MSDDGSFVISSEAPSRHIWPEIDDVIGMSHGPDVDTLRYSLTEGLEWDALMERANFMLGHVHPESGEAHILRDLLAYLGEQP